MIQPPRVIPASASPPHNENVFPASRILQEQAGNRQHLEAQYGIDYQQKHPYALRVIPSNGSPPHDENNVSHASRILQEQSSNRQQLEPHQIDYLQKHPYSLLSESHHPISLLHFSHPHAPQLYHPQPQHRQPWRFTLPSKSQQYAAPEVEAAIRYDAERLYAHFRQSEAYNKYRNRQTKDEKGGGDQKWPDHLERAFFRALVQWPPMGRRKTFWKEKLRGRNELIADCIHELTGEARDRKQVSSHIQVLKPFIIHDDYIMKWLTKRDMGAAANRYQGSMGHISGRRMSNYPVTAPPNPVQTTMKSLPHLDPTALREAKANLDIFEPVDFQIFVQQNYKVTKDHEEVERLHTYTGSTAAPLEADLHLDSLQTLDQQFPLIGAVHSQRSLSCNILDAEASLAFPKETWKAADGSPMPGIELGIYFLCTSAFLPPTPTGQTPRERAYQIRVHNTFYENGVCIKDHNGPSEARLEQSDRPGYAETRIKFGSTFWARTLGRLAGRLLDPLGHSTEVDAYLKSINATQEIVLLTERGFEHLLVIHWKFRLSAASKGRASWRRVILPSLLHSDATCGDHGERVDSVLDYSQADDIKAESQSQESRPPLMLQSPFEYESSSGSALSSATWPASVPDEPLFSQTHSMPYEMQANNNFDFHGGTINFNYDHDPNLSFDQFDSSAFNFDAATTDFAADPALQDYSMAWYDGYPGNFVEQQAIAATDSFSTQADAVEGMMGYPNQYDSQSYVPHEPQAYGGAGADPSHEDALAALADASFIASSMVPKQEPH